MRRVSLSLKGWLTVLCCIVLMMELYVYISRLLTYQLFELGPDELLLEAPFKIVKSGVGPDGSNVEVQLWGYIYPNGKVAIPPQWEDAGAFSEGLAPIKQNDRWGYIDTTGKLVIPCKYLFVSEFENGRAHADGRVLNYRVTTKTRHPALSSMEPINDGFVIALGPVPYRKMGIVNLKGQVIVSMEWDVITMESRHFLAYRTPNPAEGAEYAWFDYTGTEIWHSPPALLLSN